MIKDTRGRKTLTLLRLCLAQHTFSNVWKSFLGNLLIIMCIYLVIYYLFAYNVDNC